MVNTKRLAISTQPCDLNPPRPPGRTAPAVPPRRSTMSSEPSPVSGITRQADGRVAHAGRAVLHQCRGAAGCQRQLDPTARQSCVPGRHCSTRIASFGSRCKSRRDTDSLAPVSMRAPASAGARLFGRARSGAPRACSDPCITPVDGKMIMKTHFSVRSHRRRARGVFARRRRAMAASPDDVLVRTPEMVITRADWEAELTRIPDDQRVAFATSPQRVQAALNNLLVNRTLAERARAKGLDKDPVDGAAPGARDRSRSRGPDGRTDRERCRGGIRPHDASATSRVRASSISSTRRSTWFPSRSTSRTSFSTSEARRRTPRWPAADDARAKIAGRRGLQRACAGVVGRSVRDATNKGRLDGVTAGQDRSGLRAGGVRAQESRRRQRARAVAFRLSRHQARGPQARRAKSFDEVRSQILDGNAPEARQRGPRGGRRGNTQRFARYRSIRRPSTRSS